MRTVAYVQSDVELVGTQSEVDVLGENQGELDEACAMRERPSASVEKSRSLIVALILSDDRI